jgi:hypothetical protein
MVVVALVIGVGNDVDTLRDVTSLLGVQYCFA